MCIEFISGVINEITQPKSLVEFLIAGGSGFLGVWYGFYLGQKQANKVKEEQDQLLREVLLKNCLAVTNSNRTLLQNDGINYQETGAQTRGEVLGQVAMITNGLTTESYFALMDTGLQQVLAKDFQDAILYVRALVVQLKAKGSGFYERISHPDPIGLQYAQKEWRSFKREFEEAHNNLLGLREKIKSYLLSHNWKLEEIE
jgi:hypothetical protein